MQSHTKTLSSGAQMPVFGLGTFAMDNSEVIKTAIIDLGYRMLDCASFYKNEEMVGNALSEVLASSKVTREEMFIVSKVWWDEVEDVEAACKRSMQRLGVEYLDLYLIHWPIA
jgi:2,5-diketo-D-gluconate reductase A